MNSIIVNMRIEDYLINNYLENIIEPLQNWFSENARTLPWRSEPTPYHVWISEIMLQQTRVEAVKTYYERFLKTCPDIRSLAESDEETYLKLWEGLGYYSRVRNLHKAAVKLQEEYDGKLPEDFNVLLKIPGIGRYTAGAISSLAYGKPEPAVDGNVLRVLMRLSGDDSDIMLETTKRRTEDILRELMMSHRPAEMIEGTDKLPIINPRIFNQALMELGALVCVPNGAPHCESCPCREWCTACREETTDLLPVKKKAKERKIEERTILILKDEDRLALRKRPEKGLLAGLWELPNYLGYMTEEEAVKKVQEMGYAALHIEEIGTAKHIFSHVEWHMKGYRLKIEEEEFATAKELKTREKEKLVFLDTETVRKDYAVPNAFAYFMKIMGFR